jgi:hypothetical protein
MGCVLPLGFDARPHKYDEQARGRRRLIRSAGKGWHGFGGVRAVIRSASREMLELTLFQPPEELDEGDAAD